MIKTKRIYEEPNAKDRFRILVDRLWPRGVSKENADIDLWLKEIAPSDKLRKWFSHDPLKWKEFKKKYNDELKNKLELLDKIHRIEKEEKVITLVYATKDEKYNNAIALRSFLTTSKNLPGTILKKSISNIIPDSL